MAFAYRLEREDGTPADPPTFRTAVPNWRPGDVIPLGGRSLRVVEVRDDDAEQAPRLVVEDLSGPATSESAESSTAAEIPRKRSAPKVVTDL
jgi:hypothetical protein